MPPRPPQRAKFLYWRSLLVNCEAIRGELASLELFSLRLLLAKKKRLRSLYKMKNRIPLSTLQVRDLISSRGLLYLPIKSTVSGDREKRGCIFLQ